MSGIDSVSSNLNDVRFQRAERGWLIERKFRGVPAWWNGLRFVLTDNKGWDFESTKGIVFADWASAEATLNNLRVETMQRSDVRGPHAVMNKMELTVTEHEWPRTGEHPSDETGVLPPGTPDPRWEGRQAALRELAAWVDSRIEAEVAHRPDVNIYKRTLAETWGQMERKLMELLQVDGSEAPSQLKASGELPQGSQEVEFDAGDSDI